MPPAGFEPAIPVNDQPQTLALDRSATGFEPAKANDRLRALALYRRVTGIRSPHRPARTESLCRPSSPTSSGLN